MSPRFGQPSTPTDHERADGLSVIVLDEPLDPADAAWLEAHLAGCDACAATAAAYQGDRLLLRSLREMPLEAPRDLWARTAAALETESGRHSVRGPVRSRWSQAWAPLAAVMVLAVAVGAGLFNGGLFNPAVNPDGSSTAVTAQATPFALTAGQVQTVSRSADGRLQIQTRSVDHVCPIGAVACGVAPSFEAAPVAGVGGSAPLDAILSPSRDRMVLVGRGDGAKGVYVVTVSPAVATSSPKPTTPPPPTGGPTGSPATASPVETVPASTAPAETPPETPAPTDQAPSPSDAATPGPSDAVSPQPSPSVTVTPTPDGAIEIASNVLVVGTVAAYDATGRRFAFTARPSDGSAGPDIYVWNTTDPTALAITTDHASVFAGWQDKGVLVSRLTDGAPGTFLVDAGTGETIERVGDGWLPAVSPDGRRAAWWDGAVTLSADGTTFETGAGRLVLGRWGDHTAGAVQVLSDGPASGWDIRWDADGSVIAVWLADGTPDGDGLLSLYRIDGLSGRAELSRPLLAGEPAFAGFALDGGRIAWSSPSSAGEPVVTILAWSGDSVGRIVLPAGSGGTIVR
ncbi:MAG: zf-HC2 domain-containing protein [Chloroflexota bacterium]